MAKGPTVVENILTPEEIKKVYSYCKSTNKWGELFPEHANTQPYEDFWKGRCISGAEVEVSSIQYLMLYKRELIKKLIHINYNAEIPLYSDTLNFIRWPEGYELYLHADNINPNGHPHNFPYREFASVIYLNDDYNGGQMYFPQWEFEPEMKPGSVCIAPAGLDYMHGVKKISDGVRYTISSFYTYDRSKADLHDQE